MSEPCASCYGTGEIATDQGVVTCPDCFGGGTQANKVEWRLRELERTPSLPPDVGWLIHEVRRGREALLRILTRCQDADENDVLARDVKYQANEALGLYTPETD